MTNKKQSRKEAKGSEQRVIRARVSPSLKLDVAIQSAVLGETEQEFVTKAV